MEKEAAQLSHEKVEDTVEPPHEQLHLLRLVVRVLAEELDQDVLLHVPRRHRRRVLPLHKVHVEWPVPEVALDGAKGPNAQQVVQDEGPVEGDRKRHVHDEVRHGDGHDVMLESARVLVVRQREAFKGEAVLDKVVAEPRRAQHKRHNAVQQAHLLAALPDRVHAQRHQLRHRPDRHPEERQPEVPAEEDLQIHNPVQHRLRLLVTTMTKMASTSK
mmetsp:Transcript_12092/g.31338  ORF Transcript_12092/g.31338 Transcript_12092/m.31338 type:complete len:216 (-) Transcript_12092:454-1101(-)